MIETSYKKGQLEIKLVFFCIYKHKRHTMTSTYSKVEFFCIAKAKSSLFVQTQDIFKQGVSFN